MHTLLDAKLHISHDIHVIVTDFLCFKGKKVWKTFVFTPLFYNFACKLFLDGCEFSPPFDY